MEPSRDQLGAWLEADLEGMSRRFALELQLKQPCHPWHPIPTLTPTSGPNSNPSSNPTSGPVENTLDSTTSQRQDQPSGGMLVYRGTMCKGLGRSHHTRCFEGEEDRQHEKKKHKDEKRDHSDFRVDASREAIMAIRTFVVFATLIAGKSSRRQGLERSLRA